MADQRIKGQEVEVVAVVNGAPAITTTDVRSMEVAFKFDMLQEGYLGETTDRYDEVFKGIRGSIEFHVENEDFLTIVQSILDRARRRTPGTKINIKATFAFPNGERPRVIFKDVFFGEIPFNFASRSDYGTLKLDFQGADFDRIG